MQNCIAYLLDWVLLLRIRRLLLILIEWLLNQIIRQTAVEILHLQTLFSDTPSLSLALTVSS